MREIILPDPGVRKKLPLTGLVGCYTGLIHVTFKVAPSSEAPLIFLTNFNIMIEHHRNSFNAFLNGEKNVRCEPGFKIQ